MYYNEWLRNTELTQLQRLNAKQNLPKTVIINHNS